MPAHQSITDATKIHEAKQIASATTADAGKVITPSSSTNGVGTLRKLAVDELDPAGRTPWTGWAQYADGTYTAGAPLSVTATTRTKVTIDGGGSQTNTAGLPDGVSALWDTTNNLVLPVGVNDAYDVRLSFKMKLDASSADQYCDIELDIGGSVGVIAADTKLFIKGTTAIEVILAFPVYTGTTFNTNGGTFYITPSANSKFYDFAVSVFVLHRGE